VQQQHRRAVGRTDLHIGHPRSVEVHVPGLEAELGQALEALVRGT
jgi:hypothetical protein